METIETIENKLTYRLYKPGDEEGILRLWKEESGWGELSKEQFNSWFLNTPYGDCLIVVAVDESNEVKGQIIYAPSRVIVDGKIIKSLRGAAPILDSSLRGSSMRSKDHPAFALIKNGFEIAAAQGFQYVYCFPAFGWLSMLRLFPQFLPNPTQTASYECFAVLLNSETVPCLPQQGHQTTVIKSFSEEHEDLWLEAVASMPVGCAVHREAKLLNRLLGAHVNLEIRKSESNRLVGYISIKKDGLMVDIVARNRVDLKIVFEQALYALHFSNEKRIKVPFSKLKGMFTKEAQAILQNIAYETDDYRFAFGDCLLDASLDHKKLYAASWYMTPLG